MASTVYLFISYMYLFITLINPPPKYLYKHFPHVLDNSINYTVLSSSQWRFLISSADQGFIIIWVVFQTSVKTSLGFPLGCTSQLTKFTLSKPFSAIYIRHTGPLVLILKMIAQVALTLGILCFVTVGFIVHFVLITCSPERNKRRHPKFKNKISNSLKVQYNCI